MSKRLQVLMDESELRALRRLARQQKVTVAQLVRGALRETLRQEPVVDFERKRAALRAATRHRFPTGDIDTMLAEIERGYGSGDDR